MSAVKQELGKEGDIYKSTNDEFCKSYPNMFHIYLTCGEAQIKFIEEVIKIFAKNKEKN